MAITRERFEFALNQLKPKDWAEFEQLASIFLVDEFPQLRSLGTPSGDGGRDAELFVSNEEPSIAVQYSVTEDWSGKISHTITRLKETFPQIKSLIYMTSQLIGAKSDKLVSKNRRIGCDIDIRDQTWFLDRANTYPN